MTKVAKVQTAVSVLIGLMIVQGAVAPAVLAQLQQAPAAVTTLPKTEKPAAPTAAKVDDGVTVVQESKPIVMSGRGWQKYTDYINIKQGQDTAPLTLTFNNGTATTPPFESMRIMLAGRILGDQTKFKSRVLTMNMTGALGVGGTQLIIEAYGPQGATLNWKLTTIKMSVTSVTPVSIAPNDKVTVTGKNFTAGAVVTIGSKTAKITTFTPTQLQIQVPADVEGGDQNLVVTVGGVKSTAKKMTVKASPSVTGIDMLSAPPGQQVTVSGKGFSKNPSDNQVTFNGTPASVVSASTNQLSVVIPEIAYPQWNVQIKVKTFGQESKDAVHMNIQQRVIENSGTPEN
ncbi:MAG: IPT/TIG domain-containing protein [Leptolyngbya sp.]|nr:IPT/TIG domain-containing protein [Candidatus Melainabacteria bacterium]